MNPISTEAEKTSWVTLQTLAQEPFRVFFVLAVLSGIAGALLWPVYFMGWSDWYPGGLHARLMTQGFFGGFILGFIGTSGPRLLTVPSLTLYEVGTLLSLHSGMIVAWSGAWSLLGDTLFLMECAGLLGMMGWRWIQREDLPPPGFLTLPLAFACGAVGTCLDLMDSRLEDSFFALSIRPLLRYQAFVLLPILGVGGFILPRFFGLSRRTSYVESRTPPKGWIRESFWVLVSSVGILGTFVLEAKGSWRWGMGLRAVLAAFLLFRDVPFWRSRVKGASVASALRIALVSLPLGMGLAAIWVEYRIAVLHLTFIFGFGLLTLCVATRVVFGHSSQRDLLMGRLRWFWVLVCVIGVGMVTRISGDFWPKIRVSHYIYGAVLWAAGLVIWAVYVLPGVVRGDSEES